MCVYVHYVMLKEDSLVLHHVHLTFSPKALTEKGTADGVKDPWANKTSSLVTCGDLVCGTTVALFQSTGTSTCTMRRREREKGRGHKHSYV